ncbi:polynucleotide adenylyltransferase PcnB [Paracandidimonas soli]|uniref:Poly(A) polymerase I n=1 Tax=Paracandidimonas soli TaxID=1917182 RepID=A0A4R3VCX8_9BURK|nr:polynucleotide adenylyltransferase PcnB [Paracandidimonas soli]TCV03176.1 poly(A) polymerase [Paracandidimonas soli]
MKGTIKTLVNRLFPPARGPQRLARDKHGIDKRKVSRHAIKVCEVLHQHGYAAYIVGGAVRDLIVGLAPKDFDVATNATPNQIRPLFRRARIIGKRFQLVHVVFGPEIIETSTFRAPASEEQDTDEHGRILRDNLFGTHEQDAARRDFTLNALYYDPIEEIVIDYHNGVRDLQKRRVRMIGDPETRYREDPVRMLRALRFSCKLDAEIVPATREPIQRLAGLLQNVPDSRLFDEMLKLLTCGHGMTCLRELHAYGLDKTLMPWVQTIFSTPEDEAFVTLALDRTDKRILTGKTISPSFLLAALLWKPVYRQWNAIVAKGEPPAPALVRAADEALERQSGKLGIQKRYVADMHDIWFMQPRFERANTRSIWRMLEQPRFRAAVDFLQLRAEAHEVDSVFAQWWMDLANAGDTERARLIEEREAENRGKPSSGARRRRTRRRGPRKAAAAGAQTDTGGAGAD